MFDNQYFMLLLVVAVGAIAYFFYNRKDKGTAVPEKIQDKNATALQLQAYERLILLADRISIPNLIGRIPYDNLSAREMQLALTRTIRDEFDYNITQQIYVNPESWKALKNLKEHNLLIINQVTALLPVQATALDLNKALLEYLVNDPKADMQELVSAALSFEAKRLL